MRIMPRGQILFCCSQDTEECIYEAKNYILENNLTAENVRIVRIEGCILVKTKQEVEWKQNPKY